MKTVNSLPVNDDVLDRLFHFAPSVDALASLALTSKAFHDVFSRHPTSINLATAYNIAGPALPQAIRVVRCPEYVSIYERNNNDDERTACVENTLPAETMEMSPITTAELRALEHVANVAIKLEHLFSISYKDRTSAKSKLTSSESWRFRRALYRIMLFQKVFSDERYMDEKEVRDDAEDGDIDREFVDDKRIKKERKARQDFLEDCCSSPLELSQLQVVVQFLAGLVCESMGLRDPVIPAWSFAEAEYGLSIGSEGIFETYADIANGRMLQILSWVGDSELDGDTHRVLEEYLIAPVRNLLAVRDVKDSGNDTEQWKVILDSVEGDHDNCKQCGAPEGMKLWAEPNWESIPGVSRLSVSTMREFLPGHLQYNQRQPNPAKTIRLKITNNGIQAFLHGIFANKSLEFENWNKEDWICFSCLKKLVGETLVYWLLEEQRQAGEPILEDCWYGYNCRTQTHSPEHALKLNHLCPERKKPS